MLCATPGTSPPGPTSSATQPLARRICNEPLVLFRDGERPRRGARRPLLPPRRAAASRQRRRGGHPVRLSRARLRRHRDAASRIPGQKPIPEDARVRSYPVVEKDQLVWVWMGDAALADPAKIVDFPYHNDAAKWPNKHDVYPIKGNYMLMVDNLMDLTHLGYLHAKTVGGNPATHVEAEMKTVRTPTGLKFTRWMRNSVPPPSYVKAAGFQGRVDRCQEFEFVAPSTILQWTGAADAGSRSPMRQARFPLPVPPVPRPDPGDRHQLLLFLVGGQRLPPERPGGDRAALPRDRADLCRGPGHGRGAAGAARASSARRAWSTSPPTPTACTCAAWSSA